MNYIIVIICSLILPIFSLQTVKPKLCINCKYFISDNDTGKLGKCSLFEKKEGDIFFLVNGIKEEENYYCSVSRSSNHMCGEEGKYYKKNIVKNGRIK
jgi:hypothetical protein